MAIVSFGCSFSLMFLLFIHTVGLLHSLLCFSKPRSIQYAGVRIGSVQSFSLRQMTPADTF